MSTLSPEITAALLAGIMGIAGIILGTILGSWLSIRLANQNQREQTKLSLRKSLKRLKSLQIPSGGCNDAWLLNEVSAQCIEITDSLSQLAKPRYAEEMESIFNQFNSAAQEWGNNQGRRLYGELQILAKKLLTELDDW